MNKNLNLVEILKDCPIGTKLYSTIYGEVEFEKIITGEKYPIAFSYCDIACEYHIGRVTKDGKNMYSCCGECTLFPEKHQRDWSKFKVEPEMIDGEFYYCSYGNNQKENSFIFIYEKHPLYKTKCYVALGMFCSVLFKDDLIASNNNITELRKATVEEKQQLLDAIKVRNYEWDADKKVLVRIEQKFDINTLKSFDKVLVRSANNELWLIDFFSHIIKNNNIPSPIFCCMSSIPQQCIPYNNETKHLIGTEEMPPKKYITWEE